MNQPDRLVLRAIVERSGDASSVDERTVPVTISTSAPVARGDGVTTVLPHTVAAVDMSRAVRGLPLLESHQHTQLPIGRVDALSVDESAGRLTGVARFSRTARGEAAWLDVRDGIVQDVSIGAQVAADAWVESDEGATLTASRWTPVEVSIVSIGADEGAGINRGIPMGNKERAADAAKGADSADVSALFEGLGGERWVTLERDCLREGDSLEVVRGKVLAALKSDASSVPDRGAGDVRPGADSVERYCDAMSLVMRGRCGLVPASDRQAHEAKIAETDLSGMSMREMAREYLRVRNVRAPADPYQMVGLAMRLAPAIVTRASAYHGTSDFLNVITTSANASLAAGYNEAPETYAAWTRNVTLSNFQPHSFPNLSAFSDLEEVPEGGEYKRGTFSDRVETATLRTYGKMFPITRQAIANDNLSALTDVPRAMGRAAARQVGDLVYSLLFADVVLSDQAGATLFNTTDGTLASSAAAISTASLDAGRVALRTRTDPSGATLNITPVTLLVPAGIETAASVQIASEKDPGEGGTTSFDKANPFRNALRVVAEPRLDGDDANAWYLLAAPGREVETIVVGWLDGRMTPVLEQQDGWYSDGVEHKVRIDCTAAALDWRGMFKNDGA